MIEDTGSGLELKQQNDGEGMKQEGSWAEGRFVGTGMEKDLRRPIFRLGSPQPRLRTPQLDTELIFFRRIASALGANYNT